MTDRARAITRHATRAARCHHQADRVRTQFAGEQRVLQAGDTADFYSSSWHVTASPIKASYPQRTQKKRSIEPLFACFASFADECFARFIALLRVEAAIVPDIAAR